MDAGTLELIGRIVLAAVLGAGIGLQREMSRKPAGLRTHALICMGAALFTVVSFVGFGAGDADWVDTSRVAAGVVTGIGFLGAGTIIRDRGGVQGLTTAACVWSIAAIGIASGAGEYILASSAAALAAVILAIPKIKE